VASRHLLLGLAFGLGFSSLSVAATAGVPDAEQGLAASLFQTSFQVGGAIVLAIVLAGARERVVPQIGGVHWHGNPSIYLPGILAVISRRNRSISVSRASRTGSMTFMAA
jgi:sugar phosphate permease